MCIRDRRLQPDPELPEHLRSGSVDGRAWRQVGQPGRRWLEQEGGQELPDDDDRGAGRRRSPPLLGQPMLTGRSGPCGRPMGQRQPERRSSEDQR
eukprot:11972807-Alexandrium_andersonii.AAC.1